MVKAQRKEGSPEQRFTAGNAVKKTSGFFTKQGGTAGEISSLPIDGMDGVFYFFTAVFMGYESERFYK